MRDIGELSAYLNKFTSKVVENVTKAQKETAKKIQEDAKDIISSKINSGGTYVNSIKVSDTKKESNAITTKIYTDATVSTLGGATYNLGYLLENGTSPHLIEPLNSSVLRFEINGETIFAKRVHHPGTIAREHFKPALEQNEYVYLENIEKAIREAGK